MRQIVVAANMFKQYFEQLKQPIRLGPGIMEANRKLRQEMEHQQIDLRMKHELWSTCFDAVHVQAEMIQYAQLGDCMLHGTAVFCCKKVYAEHLNKCIVK